MASEFSREFFTSNRIVKADLRAARTPREEDLTRIKKEVQKLYDATEVLLDVTVDESLLSGYVLQIGDRVFDNSGRHAIDQMMADKPSLATLKTRIEDYKPAATSEEGGVVISSADGIVEVEGMDRAVYGEIVTFENGAKGMVESVEPGRLGIMLFDGAETVGVGTMVTRSGKRAGIPVGDGFLGRVIDPPRVGNKRIHVTPAFCQCHNCFFKGVIKSVYCKYQCSEVLLFGLIGVAHMASDFLFIHCVIFPAINEILSSQFLVNTPFAHPAG